MSDYKDHDEKMDDLTPVRVMSAQEKELDDAEGVIRAEHEFTEADYKKLRRKIDLFLMPCLMIAYGLQYADKVSLSWGVVFNLREDTGLKGLEYQNLSSFFYLAYACAQLPMGYLLQRVPLGRGLGICIVLWGAMVMILGACNNYAQLSGVRILLGWFEAVVTPAFAILTSSWYLRREQTLRQNMYYAMNQFFSMVFGVGVYFIALSAQRKGGLAAWRVINLFLGGTTVGVGLLFLVFVGTPNEVWWLSKREKLMAHARIVSNSTGGGEQHPWKWEQVRECLKDPQYWHALWYNLLSCIPNGALSTFTTLIYRGFGFSPLDSVLYQLPGNAVTFVIIIATAVTVAKKPHLRFPACILFQLIPIGIFLFVGLAPDSVSRWAKWGVFLPIAVFSITTFLVWPLMSINIAGRTKKSFMGATALISYCVGNVVGTQIFVPADGPKYLRGLTACAVVMIVNTLNLCAWWWYYVRTNRRRDREFIESGLTEDEAAHANRVNGETDVTDMKNPHFRYAC